MIKIFEYLKRHERTGMKENLYDIVQAEFNQFETILSLNITIFEQNFYFSISKNYDFCENRTFEIFK